MPSESTIATLNSAPAVRGKPRGEIEIEVEDIALVGCLETLLRGPFAVDVARELAIPRTGSAHVSGTPGPVSHTQVTAAVWALSLPPSAEARF